MPRSAARTSGKYSGKQPAITALAAIFSTVATPFNGGMTPTGASAFMPLAANIFSTAANVGGKTGKPSVQPRSKKQPNISAGSLGTDKLDVALPSPSGEETTSPLELATLPRNNLPAMASATDSATERRASSEIVPTGWGTLTSGRFAIPRDRVSACANVQNSLLTTVAVATPALSSCTESWTLHDVHEPQSAKALITTSQRLASAAKPSDSMRVILRLATSSISG